MIKLNKATKASQHNHQQKRPMVESERIQESNS